MVEVTIILAIIGWALNIGSFSYGMKIERKRTKKENRRELILEYYPPLVEDLRDSLTENATRYIRGWQEQGHYFDILKDMAKDSTLKIIEGLDKNLYEKLKSILGHFIPARDNIDGKKDEVWEKVPREWQRWFEANFYEILFWRRNKSPETLAKELENNCMWASWRGEENLLKQNFANAFKNHFKREDGIKQFSEAQESLYAEVVRIAEEEWKPIKDEYEELNGELAKLVNEQILPRMDETLKGLGE